MKVLFGTGSGTGERQKAITLRTVCAEENLSQHREALPRPVRQRPRGLDAQRGGSDTRATRVMAVPVLIIGLLSDKRALSPRQWHDTAKKPGPSGNLNRRVAC